MGNRLSRAQHVTALATLAAISLAGVAGCKIVVSGPAPAPPTPPVAAPASSSGSVSAPGGHHGQLTRIADEGRVTYSVQLAHCQTRAGGQLPDPHCTPGSVDPAITEANIATTICRSGYTGKVRPPESETSHAKFGVAYPAYRIPDSATSELDHLVSLELGGSNDITNLWPEVGTIPNPKDKVENALRRAVCDGRVTLAAAQRAIAANWMTAQAKLGLG
jgi:hypothetical protein